MCQKLCGSWWRGGIPRWVKTGAHCQKLFNPLSQHEHCEAEEIVVKRAQSPWAVTCGLGWQSLCVWGWRSAQRRVPTRSSVLKGQWDSRGEQLHGKWVEDAFWHIPCFLQHLGGKVKNHNAGAWGGEGGCSIPFNRKSSCMFWYLSLTLSPPHRQSQSWQH